MTLVNLREWETRRPEPGTVLYQQSLSDYPTGRQLAEELTKSGRMEIFEVARGLELHATSFVGRFLLGELTVTVHPKISGAPLLNLFRYAYGLRDLELYDSIDFVSSRWAFQDLLVQQLAAEATELLKRGIQRDYECTRSDLANPRGRIDFKRFVRTAERAQATLPCVYYPRSEDTLLNRALLAGLNLAARLTTDRELKTHVRRIGEMLGATVTARPIDRQMLAEALRAMDRRTSAYKPAFTIIELLLGDQGVALDEQGTQVRLRGFLFDMNRFFQALISRFLREYLGGADVHDEFRLKGMFKYVPGQNPLSRREPSLRPDFVVMRGGQMLAVLDAKYRDLWEHSLPREETWPCCCDRPVGQAYRLAQTAAAAAAANQFVKKKSAGAAVQCSARIRPAARLRLVRAYGAQREGTRGPQREGTRGKKSG